MRTLPTKHLADAVVGQDLVIGIYSLTPDKSEPRMGTLNVSWKFGDQENKQLSAEECEYVLANLMNAVTWWERNLDKIQGLDAGLV